MTEEQQRSRINNMETFEKYCKIQGIGASLIVGSALVFLGYVIYAFYLTSPIGAVFTVIFLTILVVSMWICNGMGVF